MRSDLPASDDHAMTVTADAGNIWSDLSSDELVRYDVSSNTLSYFATGITTSSYETRLGYDADTHSIYFGGFSAGALYRFDIATSTVTRLADHPESYLNDIFCADRSGHIYAAGGWGGQTMWQYDIATDTWTGIPDYPVDHGDNGSCSVHEDGWLYVEPGASRLQLL